MEDSPQISPDDRIKLAEIAKLAAEKAKLEAETREILDRFSKPWYLSGSFLKALVGGIVSIPVVWWYVENIAKPALQMENLQLARQNELVEDSLSRQRKEYERQFLALKQEQADQKNDQAKKLQELQGERDKILAEKKALETNYERMAAEFTVSKEAKDRIAQRLASLKKEQLVLEKTGKEFDVQVRKAAEEAKAAQVRFKQVQAQFMNNANLPLEEPGIRIVCLADSFPSADNLKKDLKDRLGLDVEIAPLPAGNPGDPDKKRKIFYAKANYATAAKLHSFLKSGGYELVQKTGFAEDIIAVWM
jgi:DNA repair exonuclease SbcCD ATPase subunit